MGRGLITVADVEQAASSGLSELPGSPQGCIITPGAVDKAEELGIALPPCGYPEQSNQAAPSAGGQPQSGEMVRQVCAMVGQRLPHDLSPGDLKKLVREVVESKVAGSTAPVVAEDSGASRTCVGDVCFVSGQRVLDQGAGPVPVDEKVLVANAIGGTGGTKLAGGYMEWEKASFRRKVEFPEICVVVSGELQLTVGGKTMTAGAGDLVYFPQGAKVIYSTPSQVKLACVNCLQ